MNKNNSELTIDEVKHVAQLANLSLSESQVNLFQKQLSEILHYVETLNKVDTKNIEPTSQVTGLETVIREDETGNCLTQEEALSGTKSTKDGYFKVKGIF